jgi:hypothetical protein
MHNKPWVVKSRNSSLTGFDSFEAAARLATGSLGSQLLERRKDVSTGRWHLAPYDQPLSA